MKNLYTITIIVYACWNVMKACTERKKEIHYKEKERTLSMEKSVENLIM